MTVRELEVLLFNPSGDVQTTPKATSRDVSDWFRKHRTAAFAKHNGMRLSGFVEISFHLTGGVNNWPQKELLDCALQSQIETFGMAIGWVVFGTRRSMSAKPGA